MLSINNTPHALDLDGDLDLTLELDGDDTCRHCGDTIAEYPTGWEHDTTGSRHCLDENGTAEPADAVPGNWAGITTNRADGSVQLQLSVGDPRGCLTVTLRRHTDEDGNRQLLLHLPHPGESTPHATLTELHPGTYRLS